MPFPITTSMGTPTIPAHVQHIFNPQPQQAPQQPEAPPVPNVPTPSTSHLPGMPNFQQQYGSGMNPSALGSTTGAPDNYLNQMGGMFNNFQPLDINPGNLGNMFSGYQKMYDQIGPQIPVEDVISSQQQNQLLNSAIGSNARQFQTGMRDATNRLGARGFTAESPALQATSNRLGLNEAIANTQARTDIPIQSARQNADYRLGAMQANAQQRSQDIQNFTGLENAKTGRISPLLQALVGLV